MCDIVHKDRFRYDFLFSQSGHGHGATRLWLSIFTREHLAVVVIPVSAETLKRANLELALKDAETRCATLTGSADAAFCVVEMKFDASQRAIDFRFVEVNCGFATHTGLDDAQGKTIRELVPSIEDKWIELFATVDRTHRSVRFDSPVIALDELWFEGMAFPTGNPLLHRVAVFFHNVNAKRETESTLKLLNASLKKAAAENAIITEELCGEKERAQVTLNSIGDAVICTNFDGQVTYLNVVAERLTGWASADAVGRRLEEVFHIIEAESRAVIPNPMALATAQN
jgi:PAS domain-containing protein